MDPRKLEELREAHRYHARERAAALRLPPPGVLPPPDRLFRRALAALDGGAAAARVAAAAAVLAGGGGGIPGGCPATEAVVALEELLAADRGYRAAGRDLLGWLVLAHARARRCPPDATGRPQAPVRAGLRVGDRVRFVGDVPGFWAAGGGATVLGLGRRLHPVAVRVDGSDRLVDVLPAQVRLVPPRRAPAARARAEAVFAGEGGARPDCHALLGLPTGFGPEELRRAYRRASLRAHPDKPGGSAAAFAGLAEAHAVLADPGRRRALEDGEDLASGQPFSLRQEVERYYFPELWGVRSFGDPHANKQRSPEWRRHLQRRSEL
jgi:hypothetical protein